MYRDILGVTMCCCVLQWTPEGRRLITGASSGEFTLWNGLTFNFETILQVGTTSNKCHCVRFSLGQGHRHHICNHSEHWPACCCYPLSLLIPVLTLQGWHLLLANFMY
jgi:hypothetical protein